MKIRSRIALWIGATGLGAALVASAAVFVEMRDQLQEIIAADLSRLSADFAAVAERSAGADDFSRRVALDPQSRRNLLALANDSGQMVWRSELARRAGFDRPVRPGGFIFATRLDNPAPSTTFTTSSMRL